MSIPAPATAGQGAPRRGLQVVAILLGLVALGGLLGGVAQAATTHSSSAAPLRQTGTPPSAADTGEQRSVRTYLEGKGYQVNSVGFPTDSDNNTIEGWVAVDMAMASQNFDPSSGLEQDDTTIKQVIFGFYALHHYYPDYPNLAVMLEWREFLLVFPVSADTYQGWLDNTISPDDMWAEVMNGFSAYNTQTGEQVDAKDFANKDFSGDDSNQGVPPTDPTGNTSDNGSTSTPTGPLRIRLLTSSAYLPTDGEPIRLIATINDASNARVSDRDVDFTAATTGSDAQDLGTSKTGVDGVARTDLRSSRELGAVSVSARPDTSDIANQGDQIGAAAAIVVGAVPDDDDAAAEPIHDALQAFGYQVGDTGSDSSQNSDGSTSGYGYVIENIASQRFDDSVRTQLLTSFGTLFRVLSSDVVSARVGLVYSSGNKSYLLVYSLNRGDWETFVKGDIDEGKLWQNIDLFVLDAKTQQPVDSKDFGNKNFIGGTTEDTIVRTVETKLVTESWGDQLYSGQISVAAGAYVDNFKIVQRTGNGVFAIYEASNPTTPIYSSSDDANGSKLAALRLPQGDNPGGEYMLTIASGDPTTDVKISYVEHTVR